MRPLAKNGSELIRRKKRSEKRDNKRQTTQSAKLPERGAKNILTCVYRRSSKRRIPILKNHTGRNREDKYFGVVSQWHSCCFAHASYFRFPDHIITKHSITRLLTSKTFCFYTLTAGSLCCSNTGRFTIRSLRYCSIPITTLQSMMNPKLSKQRF